MEKALNILNKIQDAGPVLPSLAGALGGTNTVGDGFGAAASLASSLGFKRIGSILGGIGFLANGFTNNVNDAQVRSVGNQLRDFSMSTNGDVSSFNDLDSQYQNVAGATIDIGDINQWGKKGFLSSGSRRRVARNEALEALDTSRQMAFNNLSNAGTALNQRNMAAQYNNLFATGGSMTHGGIFDNGLSWINNGGTHEANPNNGVQIGIAPDGIPNLVEEGEVIYNDYVFSNRLKIPKKLRDKYKFKKGFTFADGAKKLQKESEERPHDPISKNGLETFMADLMQAQEEVRMSKQARQAREQLNSMSDEELLAMQQQQMMEQNPEGMFAQGGHLYEDGSKSFNILKINPELPVFNPQVPTNVRVKSNPLWDDAILSTAPKGPKPLPTSMRYAPIWGSAIGAITSMFDKPDYSSAEKIESASNFTPSRVKFSPIGGHESYNVFDRDYYLNPIVGAHASTRRGLLNQANGNIGAAMAGMVGNDINTINSYAALSRQGAEYNDALKHRTNEFNSKLDMVNAENTFKADLANQAARKEAASMRIAGITAGAQLRDAERARIASERSANFTNLFDNLGALGQENFAFNQANSNQALRYGYDDKSGVSGYKKPIYDNAGNVIGYTSACGGMLTKKSKRRRK